MYIRVSTWKALLAVIYCNLATGNSNPKQRFEEVTRPTGTTQTITSPGFPIDSYNDDSIYIYRFNSSTNGYIRIIFSDYKLHDDSVLKIYDGYDAYASSTIWRLTTPPVFQSSTTSLYVVIKTGTFSNRNDAFYGWRIVVNYVAEHRDVWATGLNIPRRGLCPQFSSRGTISIVADISVRNLDCSWNLDFNDPYGEGQTLAVILPQNDGFSFSVHVGATSESHTRHNYDVTQNDVILYSISKGDYISISGDIAVSSSLKLAYHESRNTAIENAVDAETSDTPCAFKDCGLITTSYMSRCALYWNTCGDPSYDSSCETGDLLYCSTSQCYSTRDLCDGFYDCGGDSSSATDEITTTCEDVTIPTVMLHLSVSAIVGYVACSVFVAVVVVVLCIFGKACRKGVSSVCDKIGSCVSGLRGCICGCGGAIKECFCTCGGGILDCCRDAAGKCCDKCGTICENSPRRCHCVVLCCLCVGTGDGDTQAPDTLAADAYDVTDESTTSRSSVDITPSAPALQSIGTEAPPPSYDNASGFPPVVSLEQVDPELPSYDLAVAMQPPPPNYAAAISLHESAV